MTPRAKQIIAEVAGKRGISESVLVGGQRVSKPAVSARNEIWARLYAEGYTQGKIAVWFDRHTTTVSTGIAKHNTGARS